MKLQRRLELCKSWSSCCEVLNEIPKNNEHVPAIAINDMHEEFRLKALQRLEQLGSLYLGIVSIISQIQMDKRRYDPKGLFPCIATDEFLDTLPSPAPKCNICNEQFKEGHDIIKKGCGEHGLHSECFK
jgi:hypothetical protein